MRHALADRIEDNLTTLLSRVEEIIRENRRHVLSLAHALETHKTLTGDDVVAVIECTAGPLVDGRPYANGEFVAQLEDYHAGAASGAPHAQQGRPDPAGAEPQRLGRRQRAARRDRHARSWHLAVGQWRVAVLRKRGVAVPRDVRLGRTPTDGPSPGTRAPRIPLRPPRPPARGPCARRASRAAGGAARTRGRPARRRARRLARTRGMP